MKRSYQQRKQRTTAYREDGDDIDDEQRTTANGNESDEDIGGRPSKKR
jgi:hypothetical protein